MLGSWARLRTGTAMLCCAARWQQRGWQRGCQCRHAVPLDCAADFLQRQSAFALKFHGLPRPARQSSRCSHRTGEQLKESSVSLPSALLTSSCWLLIHQGWRLVCRISAKNTWHDLVGEDPGEETRGQAVRLENQRPG